MNREQARVVGGEVKPKWRADIQCASCGGPPSCPMLEDEVWDHAWREFGRRGMPRRAPVCSHRLRCEQLTQANGGTHGRHVKACEMNHGGIRHLLCLECTETALGRRLTLEDLAPCVGNYAHYVMQTRVVDEDLTWEQALRPMSTAPITGPVVWILAAVRDQLGKQRWVLVHYAEGGGEEQPRFRGWFKGNGSGFTQVDDRELLGWLPLPEVKL